MLRTRGPCVHGPVDEGGDHEAHARRLGSRSSARGAGHPIIDVPAMIAGLCTVELSLPTPRSLKDKRGVLKPLIAQLRKEFNVAVAEVERQDFWQSASLGLAAVSADGGNLHGLLEDVVRWIERTQPHVVVTDWHIEIL